MEILYYHSGDLILWPVGTCAVLSYRPLEWSPKCDADNQRERQRDREMYRKIDIQRYKLD